MYNYQNHSHLHNYNERIKLENSSSLGVLSQITIEKEDLDHFDFLDTTEDLKHRLEELEEITVSFLAERYPPIDHFYLSFYSLFFFLLNFILNFFFQ